MGFPLRHGEWLQSTSRPRLLWARQGLRGCYYLIFILYIITAARTSRLSPLSFSNIAVLTKSAERVTDNRFTCSCRFLQVCTRQGAREACACVSYIKFNIIITGDRRWEPCSVRKLIKL